MSLEEIQKEKYQAKKNLIEGIKNIASLRDQHLQFCADAWQQVSGEVIAIIIKYMHRHEQDRNISYKLKGIFGKTPFHRLSYILVPKEKEEWVRVTDPKQIKQIIINLNKKHFGQAQEMPFAQEQVMELTDWNGLSTISQDSAKGIIHKSIC